MRIALDLSFAAFHHRARPLLASQLRGFELQYELLLLLDY